MKVGRIAGAVLVAGCIVAPAALAEGAPPPEPPPGRVLDELFDPRADDVAGTQYREFTTTAAAGRVRGHLIRVDLANRTLAVRLLRPAVVSGTGTVPALADRVGAVAGVNGDFFDEGGTGASVGVELENGALVKSAVPLGRRPAPPGPPGSSPDAVIGIDTAGVGRIGRVLFSGTVRFAGQDVPLAGLNLYAVPVGGVAAFTPAWGGATRARTVCGSDTDPKAPCAGDAVEVRVKAGKAVAVGPVGTTAVPAGEVALVARDAAAGPLKALHPGDPVDARWTALAPDTPPLRIALGALPLVRDGAAWPGLQTTERAPRTAIGLSSDGRTLWLIAVDGRQQASVGATLAELGRLVTDLGIPQAVALDGGGSTQMVRRPAGGRLVVANVPSTTPLRAVADGLGVVPAARDSSSGEGTS